MSNISQPFPTLSMYSILNGEEYSQFCIFQIDGKTIFLKLMHTFHIFFEILKISRKSQSKTTKKKPKSKQQISPILVQKKIPCQIYTISNLVQVFEFQTGFFCLSHNPYFNFSFELHESKI